MANIDYVYQVPLTHFYRPSNKGFLEQDNNKVFFFQIVHH